MNRQVRVRLLHCIGAIDDRFLDEADAYEGIYEDHISRNRVVKYGTAGVVVSLAVAAVFLGLRTKMKNAA